MADSGKTVQVTEEIRPEVTSGTQNLRENVLGKISKKGRNLNKLFKIFKKIRGIDLDVLILKI